MKRIAVSIATTDGPARIQRITAEDPEVRSVVCLGGKAISLPISADYDAFVRNPTGIIQACFGHGAFRIDVSRQITGGVSWQLGVLVAHAVADANRLAGPDDDAATALWASGEVDRDLKVGAVRDITLKLNQSRQAFAAYQAQGVAIIIAVPESNAAEAEQCLKDMFGPDAGGFRVIGVATAGDILKQLRVALPKRRWRLSPRAAARKFRRGRPTPAAFYGAAAALVMVVALAGWNHGAEQAPEAPAGAFSSAPLTTPTQQHSGPADGKQAPQGIVAAATLARAPKGSGCAAVYFNVATAVVQHWQGIEAGRLPAQRTRGLCDLSYRITNHSGENRWVWVYGIREDTLGRRFRTRIFHQGEKIAAGKSLRVDAGPPRHLEAPVIQEFAALVTRPGIKPGNGRLRKAVEDIDRVWTRADWNRLLENVSKSGATVYRFKQEFTP
ncbi:MAG: hypothetical protein V3T02_02155 [Alphaproteobacteria bacterium]